MQTAASTSGGVRDSEGVRDMECEREAAEVVLSGELASAACVACPCHCASFTPTSARACANSS